MNIYCIRREKDILAVADFKSEFEVGIEDVPSSHYVLSSMITPEEERVISERIIDGLEKRIDYWIQDKHYFGRLFASAGVFLILYFFCSLVIRDPLPLIDELLISITGSIATWYLIARHDKKALLVKKAKEEWKRSVLDADFEYSSYMEDAEEYYHMLESLGFKTIIPMIADGSVPPFQGDVVEPFKKALESYVEYSLPLERKYIKELRENKFKKDKMEKSLLQDYSLGNVDVFLLAFVLSISKK